MDHANDGMLLCYADDGERICDLIESSSSSFNCKVLKHNICLRRKPGSLSSFILVLTPEMLEELESRPKHFLQDIVFHFQNKVLLYHESLDIQSSGLRRSLEYQCPEILKWRNYKTGNNDANFLQMCLEIFNLTNMQNLHIPMLVSFKLVPKRIWTRSDEIVITFKKPVEEHNLKVYLKHQNGDCETARLSKLNEKAFKFCPERMQEGDVTVEAFECDRCFGRTSFTIFSKKHLLSELIDDIVNPVEFLCSTLKTENLETLDFFLSQKFTNWKMKFHLAVFEDTNTENFNLLAVNTALSEYPTILHFAAKYGLSRMCKTLMAYPGYKTARLMKNKDDLIPSKLALTAYHGTLSEEIRRTEYGVEDKDIEYDSGYLTFGSEGNDRNTCFRRESPKRCEFRVLPSRCLERDSGMHGSADSISKENSSAFGRRLVSPSELPGKSVTARMSQCVGYTTDHQGKLTTKL